MEEIPSKQIFTVSTSENHRKQPQLRQQLQQI